MDEYLYRYVPLETFVGMVQSKTLTFVLPELWDDPKECASFKHYVSHLDNVYEQLALWSIYHKTFFQCWTTLAESDAMWRIYSYNNRAIRISVKRDDINLLDDVKAVDVEYSDNFDCEFEHGETGYLRTLSRKRTAFEHEREVRLIKHYRFVGEDDLKQHIYACLAISEHPSRIEVLEAQFPGESIEEKAQAVVETLNIGNEAKQFINVPFAHVNGFIENVLVHPLAPEWYVDIVQDFCVNNEISFAGKSTLYSK